MDNIISYIGKGKSNRYKHPLEGTSHIKEFNRLYYSNEVDRLSSKILCWFSDDNESLEFEKKLIEEFRPKYNTDYLKENERFEYKEKQILKYFKERTPHNKKRNSIKPNFKKLAIEYITLIEKCNTNISQEEFTLSKDRMGEILLCSDELSKYVETLGYKSLSASRYVKKVLEDEFNTHCLMTNLREDFIKFMSLENGSHRIEIIKDKIQQFYDFNGISKKAKILDLERVYSYKKTTLTGNVAAIKILGVK